MYIADMKDMHRTGTFDTVIEFPVRVEYDSNYEATTRDHPGDDSLEFGVYDLMDSKELILNDATKLRVEEEIRENIKNDIC